MGWVQKLKYKWNIKTNWDFVMIMLVFSIAGAFIGVERKGVFHALGITDHTPLWIKILVYLPLIFPLYQLNLIVFGTLLGQFRFFWEKEKQLGRFFLRLFIPR
jgi:ferrochelatase